MPINAQFYDYCQKQECSVDVEVYADAVLAPMHVESVRATKGLNLLKHTLKTHCRAGIKYLVAFVPVKEEQYEMMEKEYNRSVNQYLDSFRKPRSKHAQTSISYEEWTTSEDLEDIRETAELEKVFLADMLRELSETISESSPKLSPLFAGLVENDGEQSLEVVFEKHGIKRSTGFNQLKQLRKLVEDTLDKIN